MMAIDRISAREQRERIPTPFLIDFNGQSNEALDSMANDDRLPEQVRAYAAWELEYREANGIVLRYNRYTGELRRFDVSTERGLEEAQAAIAAEAREFRTARIPGDGAVARILRERQRKRGDP